MHVRRSREALQREGGSENQAPREGTDSRLARRERGGSTPHGSPKAGAGFAVPLAAGDRAEPRQRSGKDEEHSRTRGREALGGSLTHIPAEARGGRGREAGPALET